MNFINYPLDKQLQLIKIMKSNLKFTEKNNEIFTRPYKSYFK